MSLYDEENPLLVQPRPFWEEEPVEIAQPVVEPVAPPAAPPPEVEGPGYSSPEEIVAKAPPPEVVGPGYASPQEIPAPEVEGPGFTSLEEIPGGKPTLGDVARVGYRTLVEPLTSPLETVGKAGEALMPEGSRRAEFRDRLKRNWSTGMEETKAAARQMPSGLLSAEQNPYVYKSVEQAKSDVPLLEGQIAETEKNLRAVGGDPDLVGQEWYFGGDLTPEQRELSQKTGDLRRRLAQAKEGATGVSTESFAGTLSRSLADIAQENRDRKAEIIKEYAPLINESHNKELLMQVADSLGSSGPSMGGAMINPLFGLVLMYSQTFETSRSEFLEKGGDPAKADEYGHAQAVLQTPLEVLGELPVAGIAKGALKRLVKEADPASWVKWIKESAVELGKAELGEVGVTTPGQTIIEQKLGEQYGIKPVKTAAELAKDVWEAQKVAALQVGVAGGGPLAVEAGVRAVTPPAAAPVPPVAAPGAPAVPPPIPPTPAEAFAPPPAGAPPVTPPGVEVPGALPGEKPGYVNVGPGAPPAIPPPIPTGDERFAPPPVIPPTIETGPSTPQGDAVTQVVGKQNIGVTQVAQEKAETLQASGAPKTAEAIQQVAKRSNTEATVSAAEYLQQLQQQAADEAAEAAEKAAEAAAKAAPAAEAPGAVKPGEFAQPGYTAVAPAAAPPTQGVSVPVMITRQMEADLLARGVPQEQINRMTPVQAHEALGAPPVPAPAQAPQPAPVTEPPAAVVVGGQVFTGPTLADATRAAHAAVGTDAMATAEQGWVGPDGQFTTHDVVTAYQALDTAINESGGNMEHPAIAEAGAQLAQAQARNAEINGQIVQPGGEQVIQTGIKGQEAIVSPRPSQELVVPLAGVNVTLEGVTADGKPATAQRSAAQALNEARNERTTYSILLDCLL